MEETRKFDPADAVLYGAWLGVEPFSALTFITGKCLYHLWKAGAPGRQFRKQLRLEKRAERNRHKEQVARNKAWAAYLANLPKPPQPPTPDAIAADAHARFERNCRRILASQLPPELQEAKLREELQLLN